VPSEESTSSAGTADSRSELPNEPSGPPVTLSEKIHLLRTGSVSAPTPARAQAD
jgi:hypothetical protein